MTHEDLLSRVTVDPAVCAGKPCIRGTRIYIAIILDALAEGLTPEQIVDHYPSLSVEDIRAALAYAAELTQENSSRISQQKPIPAHEALLRLRQLARDLPSVDAVKVARTSREELEKRSVI